MSLLAGRQQVPVRISNAPAHERPRNSRATARFCLLQRSALGPGAKHRLPAQVRDVGHLRTGSRAGGVCRFGQGVLFGRPEVSWRPREWDPLCPTEHSPHAMLGLGKGRAGRCVHETKRRRPGGRKNPGSCRLVAIPQAADDLVLRVALTVVLFRVRRANSAGSAAVYGAAAVNRPHQLPMVG